jgi:DNA-binding SARP family transcriptional activator
MEARLKLYLLGSFRATRDGETLNSFRTDSVRALLAYLAMHQGVEFRREMLASLLWSDHTQEAALVNLRQILSILRRVLGDAEAAQPYLEVTPRSVCFDAEPGVWVDVNLFRQLVLGASSTGQGELKDSNVYGIEQALLLYRGDLLSDLKISSPAFEEWVIQQREHLHQRSADLLHAVACYYEREDYPEQVKYFAQRQIELEPWSEEAYRQLMYAYARLGQRSAALKQYALCQRALFSAFGVEPGAATKALYRRIANDDLNQGADHLNR